MISLQAASRQPHELGTTNCLLCFESIFAARPPGAVVGYKQIPSVESLPIPGESGREQTEGFPPKSRGVKCEISANRIRLKPDDLLFSG